MSVVQVLERYVDTPYSSESVESFVSELNLEQGSEVISEINQVLQELSMSDSIRLGRFYQRYLSELMKHQIQSRTDLAQVIGYQPDPDVNFSDPPSTVHGFSGHDSELLTLLFKLKFNQIQRVRAIGYMIPPGELAIIEAEVPYDAYIMMLNRKLSVMMNEGSVTNLSPEHLMKLNNEIYENVAGVKLPVYYLTKGETTKQVNLAQVRDITTSIASMVRNNHVFERLMIISLDKMASQARDFLNTIKYLSIAPETPDDVPSELTNIRIDVFSASELLIDIESAMIVPEHRRLSHREVNELFEQTGWTRANLQGISIEDPIVKFMGFDLDDVIEIKRLSATNSEVSDHSYAYRVVMPLSLFVSADETMMNRYLT